MVYEYTELFLQFYGYDPSLFTITYYLKNRCLVLFCILKDKRSVLNLPSFMVKNHNTKNCDKISLACIFDYRPCDNVPNFMFF